MSVVILLKLIVGLGVALLILLLLLIYVHKNKKIKKNKSNSKKRKPLKPKIEYDWNTLMKVIRNKESTTQELQDTLKILLEQHGTIPRKLGIRVNPEFDKYSLLILRLCRHPNTNKDLIIDFDKGLGRKNPEYNKELNDALIKGLNSRGE